LIDGLKMLAKVTKMDKWNTKPLFNVNYMNYVKHLFCQEHENDHDQKNFNVHKAYMTNYNYRSSKLNSTINTKVNFQAKTYIIKKYTNIILLII